MDRKKFCIESTYRQAEQSAMLGVLISVQTTDDGLIAETVARGYRDGLIESIAALPRGANLAVAGHHLEPVHHRTFDVMPDDLRPYVVRLSALEYNQMISLLDEAIAKKSGWAADTRRDYREIRDRLREHHAATTLDGKDGSAS